MAKKSLGQHFLTDPAAAQAVVEYGRIGPDTNVLEVGPGKGFLTRHLLAAGAQLAVVEKDDRLAAALRERFPVSQLTVHVGDFLKLDLRPHAGSVLVGNLPFNVSLPILRRGLEHGRLWPRMVFMFQLEVARRICAEPGGKQFGIPTIMAALTHRATIIRKVPAGAFYPRPRVDSALVLLEPLDEPKAPRGDRERFVEFIAAAFRYRRKTAVNAITTIHKTPSDAIEQALGEIGADRSVRLEKLSVDRLLALWRLLA